MAPIRSPLATRWCFTINNPEQVPLDHTNLHKRITYLHYSLEIGASGTPHLQGYLELSSRSRRTWLISNLVFLGGAFLTPARGDATANQEYIAKNPVQGPFTFGEEKTIDHGGPRNELADVKDLIEGGSSNLDIFREFPNVAARYPKFIDTYRALHRESLVVIPPFTPRFGWQANLAAMLDGNVDGRKVNWAWSATGNLGKSYFANNYKPEDSYTITGGKYADIFHTLSPIIHSKRVIFFDYARVQGDAIPYPVIEALKNGMFTSTKYESRTIRFNPVHVVVFSNGQPDLNSLSLDRWNIIQIV